VKLEPEPKMRVVSQCCNISVWLLEMGEQVEGGSIVSTREEKEKDRKN
jgi:hypothetical protein